MQAALNLLGVDTMAAWTAYGKIDSVFWMINSSFGIALTTFVGQNFGAGKWDRVRRGTRVCLGMAVGTAICLTAVLMMAGRFLLGIFTGDAVVVEIGLTMMRNIAPAFVMFVFIEIFFGFPQSAGIYFCDHGDFGSWGMRIPNYMGEPDPAGAGFDKDCGLLPDQLDHMCGTGERLLFL